MKEFIDNINIILIQEQKRQIGILVVFMIVSALLEVCGISTVLPIVSALLNRDFMYSNVYARSLCSICGIATYESFVIVSIAILLVVFSLKNLFLLIKTNYHTKFTLNFQYELRRRVFHRYLEKDYLFYFDNNSSDIYKTLVDDVTKTNLSFDGFLHILTDSFICIFLMIAVLVIDFRVSLVMIFTILLVSILISRGIRPVIKKNGEIAYNASKIRNKWILQALQGIKTVKSTGKGFYFENKAYETDLSFSKAEKTYRVLNVVPRMILELFSISSFVILIAILVLKGNNFELLIPKIGAIGMAFIKLFPGTNSIISNITSIRYRSPSVKRIADLMCEEEKNNQDGEFPEKYQHSIEVSNITYKYNYGPYIFDNASLSIPIGKMIGFVGVSGEGKTTFVDILLGLLKIESGNICVDGIDINQNVQKWRNSISYITQDVFLLDDSIRANIAFGIEEKDIREELIWDVLEKAQLASFVRSLPNIIDTKIGEKGVKLSGGQKQRIGIARALYRKPQILIFDEATSSLDADTEIAVVDSINHLQADYTILVIAHRSKALEQCDAIYRVNDGKIKKTHLYKNIQKREIKYR